LTKILNKLFTILCASILFISGISCASKTSTAAVTNQVVTVQRGNLAVTVSVDGNLVMPNAYSLTFGAPGEVEYVIGDDDPTGQHPAEGRYVKAGTVLASLDDTSERLQFELDNNAVQQTLSNLYETVPLLPQFPEHSYDATNTDLGIKDSAVVYPFYYPNRTALTSFEWAQDEASRARDLLQTDSYTAAASELYVADSDLEACAQILEDAINNPESGLGNIAPFVNQDEPRLWAQEDQSSISFIVELQKLDELIKQGQADLEKVQTLITQGNYGDSDSMLADVLSRMEDINGRLTDNVNRIKQNGDTTIYGRDISLYFYGAAEEKLNAALAGVENGGLNSPDLNNNLRIAQHYIQLCNGILGSNELVLQHGLSLQNTSNYNIALAQKLASLKDDENNLLSTAIFAPFDGTVVSVGVKDKDILSEQDRSSRTAVTIVDTKTIQFQGLVDEIDILKIATGDNATISVDAVPDKTFTGHVSFISHSGIADNSGVVKFNITIALDPTDVDLKGDLTATADITVSTTENALLLPLTAVTTTSEGSFVNVMNDATGKPEKRQVTLGSQNLQFAEVLSGLKEGDKVVTQEKATGATVTTRPQFGPPGGGGGGPPGGG
jgi:multidrug efflux pump subunit AcrA (membrane-fusion protein)